jgi:hypothetical protein
VTGVVGAIVGAVEPVVGAAVGEEVEVEEVGLDIDCPSLKETW